MKNHKCNIFKVLSFVCVFIFFIGVFPVSASATSFHLFDFADYIGDISQEDDGYTYADIDIPDDWTSWHVYPYGKTAFSKHGSNSVEWEQGTSGSTSLYYFPFGDPSVHKMSLSKIPVGATLSFAFQLYHYGGQSTGKNPYIGYNIEYFDCYGNIIDTQAYSSGVRVTYGSAVVFNVPLIYPANAVNFSLRIDLNDLVALSGSHLFESLDNNIQIYMETAIWNLVASPLVPNNPGNSGDVNDFVDFEQSILDDSESGRNTLEYIIEQGLSVVGEYASAFASVSYIFNCFAHVPFISGLLYVSLTFGCVASILGIVGSVVSSLHNNDSRKAMKESRNNNKGG